jgi:putative spermidine/putrescine transport system permease protein
MKKGSLWSWVWISLGFVYFFVPLLATVHFSLKAKRDVLSFTAYERVLADPRFLGTFEAGRFVPGTFLFSTGIAFATIAMSLLIIVPTAYWVHLRLPRIRPIVEFLTLMPFVVPPVILVFGLIRIYSRPPLALTNQVWTTNLMLIGAYTVLSFPYMYRAVDTGLRSMDVRSLTEAAQSLGAGWTTILLQVIFPNLRVALLSGAFLTFAIVIGEYTIAVFLARPAFGPYLALLIQDKAYEPAALSVMSFALTWSVIGLIQFLSRDARNQAQLGGAK